MVTRAEAKEEAQGIYNQADDFTLSTFRSCVHEMADNLGWPPAHIAAQLLFVAGVKKLNPEFIAEIEEELARIADLEGDEDFSEDEDEEEEDEDNADDAGAEETMSLKITHTKIGVVCVDTGTLVLGDPSHIDDLDFGKMLTDGELAKQIRKKLHGGGCQHRKTIPSCVSLMTGIGDGFYEVEAEILERCPRVEGALLTQEKTNGHQFRGLDIPGA
jgi:hypothetical protein